MRIRDGDILDPGWKKVGSGINIPDPQHCSRRYLLPGGLDEATAAQDALLLLVAASGRQKWRHQ
jgi:hypothetical protein